MFVIRKQKNRAREVDELNYLNKHLTIPKYSVIMVKKYAQSLTNV